MASLYPAGLDELNAGVGTPSDPLSAPSHPAHHTALADAVEAIEGELGTDPSGAAATVKARLDGLDTTVSGKAASSHSHAESDVTGLVADLAGKVPASLVDAKGDIIAATANDTVARLGVGTNGHVLTADSAQSTGLKWAAASGSGDPTMGGDLSGLASSATIVAGAVTDSKVAAGNKDGAAGTPSMRTLGTGASQAAAGNHAHSGVYEPADSDLTAVAGLASTGLIERTGAGTAATRTVGVSGASDIPSRSDADGRYVQQALVDAKGDVVTATANDTPARLGVGTDGQVLTADSAQSTGLKWAAAGGSSAAAPNDYIACAGHYYQAQMGAVPLTTGSIAGYDRVFYLPLLFAESVTVAQIGIYLVTVGTAGAGSATCAIGIYSSSANKPSSRILSAGTLDLTATTGTRFISVSQALSANTLYWLALTHGLQGTAPQMRGPAYNAQNGATMLGAHNLDSFSNAILGQWNRGTFGWVETRTYDGTVPASAGTV